VIKPQSSVTENQQTPAELLQMHEPESTNLLTTVEAGETDIRPVSSLASGSIEKGISTQDDLKISNDEFTLTLTVRQARDTLVQLQNWDNEGGRTEVSRLSEKV
jgi:hypothetical protein